MAEPPAPASRCRTPAARWSSTGSRFGYVPDRPVLPGLDLVVPAGQTVALVGTTGAGKTTIAKLMARFYDPTAGRVTLDGVDLRELDDADLRRHVVMVTQENFMFDGSVGRQHPLRPPGRHPGRGRGGGRARSARTTSSPPCPRATTPTSPSAAVGSRPGSGSWWRSRGRSSPTRRC